jgi:hypothetical protein
MKKLTKCNVISYSQEKLKNKLEINKLIQERVLGELILIRSIRYSKRIKFYALAFVSLYIVMNTYKWYKIIYYYIMYDIDIRKPKVSDYIINRFR